MTTPDCDARRPIARAGERLRFPLLQLTAALLLTMGLVGWLLWVAANDSRLHADQLTQALRISEVRGTIAHLDDVLTMSAQMATVSGNLDWQRHYDRFVPLLDAAIADAKALSRPEARANFDRTTRAANDALVDMESLAFAAVAKGDLQAGRNILASDEYARQKQIYASGIAMLSAELQDMIAAQGGDLKRQRHLRLVYAALAAATVVGLWLNVALTMCRWRRRMIESELRASRLADATLEGILFHDDRGIIDANRAFTEMLGTVTDSVIGRPVSDFVRSEERAAVAAALAARDGEVIDAILLRGDGEPVPVELRTRPFDLNGRTVCLTAIQDVTERRRAAERISRLAHFDSLTGLPNRVLFWDRLGQALAVARRRGRQVAVLCIDLDRFKEVNDTLGHAAGDRLLRQVAERLVATLRDSDTLARLGGDEFALIMTDLSEGRLAAEGARRIVDELSQTFDLDGNEAVIGASVGIALSGENAHNEVQALVRCADLALYRAKEEGRGTFRFYAEEMNVRLQARKTLERQLRQAMIAGQFELYYQPQVEAGSWRMQGMEALVRWRHPERGVIMPKEFVPLAEETGLIITLGEWVLRTACRQAQPWGDLRLAVNLSAAQFRQSGLHEMVARALTESGLEPGRLELEVTESILLQDIDASLATLQKIKALGVRIAMDDFGTGYSSLSYLRCFPFDKIKIDGSFVRDLGRVEEANAIVRAVLQLGRSLGIRTSAEGVETRAQADFLLNDGCDEVQGFHFGAPMAAAELEQMLAQGCASPPLSLPRSGAAA